MKGTVVLVSCGWQYKNQTLWPQIVGFKPQVYLWTGDTIYVKDGTVPNLRKQFEKQLANPGMNQRAPTRH
jgi:hypothetical protein